MSPAEILAFASDNARREFSQPMLLRDPNVTPMDLRDLDAIVGRLKGAFICSESREERRALGAALLPLVQDLDALILACGLDS